MTPEFVSALVHLGALALVASRSLGWVRDDFAKTHYLFFFTDAEPVPVGVLLRSMVRWLAQLRLRVWVVLGALFCLAWL